MTTPLVDLHRHLDGNVRLNTIIELADQHGIELPSRIPEQLRPHVQIMDKETGLMAFIARFRYLTAVMVDFDAIERIARENVHDAAAEGIAYVELRFSPWFMAETHGLDAGEVVDAVVSGAQQGMRETGVRAELIGILSRTYGPEICRQELDALLARAEHLIAVDLAGDEAGFPPGLFVEHFRRVRDAELGVTIHAGEAAGPDSMWSAIRDLGATRIGHGIRCIEDPALVDYLAARRIGLEVCLTSNVHTQTVPDLASHPIGQLLDAGILCCLNTDDPSISGVDLNHEYEQAAAAAGLDQRQLEQLKRNGVEMAFGAVA